MGISQSWNNVKVDMVPKKLPRWLHERSQQSRCAARCTGKSEDQWFSICIGSDESRSESFGRLKWIISVSDCPSNAFKSWVHHPLHQSWSEFLQSKIGISGQLCTKVIVKFNIYSSIFTEKRNKSLSNPLRNQISVSTKRRHFSTQLRSADGKCEIWRSKLFAFSDHIFKSAEFCWCDRMYKTFVGPRLQPEHAK